MSTKDFLWTFSFNVNLIFRGLWTLKPRQNPTHGIGEDVKEVIYLLGHEEAGLHGGVSVSQGREQAK